MEKHQAHLEMRLKIESVFERSAAQSEYYKQASTTIETEERQKRVWRRIVIKFLGPRKSWKK